jgi:hypothetical protein
MIHPLHDSHATISPIRATEDRGLPSSYQVAPFSVRSSTIDAQAVPANLDRGSGTWTLLPNAPRASGALDRHDDIFFVNPSTGWLVNGNGDVWQTTNGGDNWSLLTYRG